jgi:glycerol-3-phosphate cytidylyltransferase-like family protein
MDSANPSRIVYSFLIGDLFTYGHLRMLEKAKAQGDWHVCGVITDEVALKWTSPLICNFQERKAVLEKITVVDEVMAQDSMDPSENLKLLHLKFPNAKLCLLQSHHLWNSSLGAEYVQEINGEIITNEFYHSLSRDFIKNKYLEHFASNGSEDKSKQIDSRSFNFFSTKANTLKKLKSHLTKASIEPSLVFTVADWKKDDNAVLEQIRAFFGDTLLVVRSSSLNEDAMECSNAGKYESVLDIRSSERQEVKAAVTTVIASYERHNDFLGENQVLIQKQTGKALISGVVFSRNLWTNTPYYLISYDDYSGRTDTVTGGVAGKRLEILKDLKSDQLPLPWNTLIEAIREIESFFSGIFLDVEFAINGDGTVVIFQVRPLAANSRFNTLPDDKITNSVYYHRDEFRRQQSERSNGVKEYYLSDMAFWNPAELIGDRPSYLDSSLFEHILMKTNWNEALIPLGYTEVKQCLQTTLASKPYIVLNYAFKTLLPSTLPERLKYKLLNHYNEKLRSHPELHDKIEFQIVHNCFTFDFESKAVELRKAAFTENEIFQLRTSLIALTNHIFHLFSSTVINDTKDINLLESRCEKLGQRIKQENSFLEKIQLIYDLIEDCRQYGTSQFTRMARMAFIASALLKSLGNTGHLTEAEINLFMTSISTVATEIEEDFHAVGQGTLSKNDFLKRYGHLRPGTYDITQMPYNKSDVYLNFTAGAFEPKSEGVESEKLRELSNLEVKVRDILDLLSKQHNISSSGSEIIFFIRKAIELREKFKFIYSKNISAALELLADIGEDCGMSRKDMSLVDYYNVVNHRHTCSRPEIVGIWKSLAASRKQELEISRQISLPPIVISDSDFTIVPSYISKPNFVTNKAIIGDIVVLSNPETEIKGKIVVLEKADPGYDWIFTKHIAGLITKYGGAASHMAIRSAEFGLPAAIGCGDLIYSNVVRAQKIKLDCDKKNISIITMQQAR